MTDDEAATLCGIALSALMCLPDDRRTYKTQRAATLLQYEIADLRHRTPEDIQNEFEGKGR